MAAIAIGSGWVRRACGTRVEVTRVVVVPGNHRIDGGERVIVRDVAEPWRQRSMLTPTFRAYYAPAR